MLQSLMQRWDTCPRRPVETAQESNLGMDEGLLASGTEKAIYKASIGVLRSSWCKEGTYQKDGNVWSMGENALQRTIQGTGPSAITTGFSLIQCYTRLQTDI